MRKDAATRLDNIKAEFDRCRELGVPYPEWDELDAVAAGQPSRARAEAELAEAAAQ